MEKIGGANESTRGNPSGGSAALLVASKNLKDQATVLEGHLIDLAVGDDPANLEAKDAAATAEASALDAIAVLDQAKRIIEAKQAIITASIHAARVEAKVAAKKSDRNVASEVAMEIGLRRHLNGAKARRLVGAAIEAPEAIPHTFAKWTHGAIDEAIILAFLDETALLTPEARLEADAAFTEIIGDLGDRDLRERLRAFVNRVEPELAAERYRNAQAKRRVTSRSRPDGMLSITALLPGIAGQGVASILHGRARSLRAQGDERTQDQIQADVLTGIVIGWAQAAHHCAPGFANTHNIGHADSDDHDPPAASSDAHQPSPTLKVRPSQSTESTGSLGEGEAPSGAAMDIPAGFAEVEEAYTVFKQAGVGADEHAGSTDLNDPGGFADGWVSGIGVNVHLTMTDLAAFGITDTPAEIYGLGPVPAHEARAMIEHANAHHAATLRRLYTAPESGAFVAMESRSRTFPDGLATMISIRDKHCRFPYCDAPIRHLDHIDPHAHGGTTSYANGQGLCAHHNLIKDVNGTTSTMAKIDGGTAEPNDIVVTLASGRTFTSPARPFPHENPSTVSESIFEAGRRQGRNAAESRLADAQAEADGSLAVAGAIVSERFNAWQKLISWHIRSKSSIETERARLDRDRERLTRDRQLHEITSHALLRCPEHNDPDRLPYSTWSPGVTRSLGQRDGRGHGRVPTDHSLIESRLTVEIS